MKTQPAPDFSDLDALLASCHRNGRLPKFPVEAPKQFFDADRFRWWFRYGANTLLGSQTFEGYSFQQIRDWMDSEMRKHLEQVHQ